MEEIKTRQLFSRRLRALLRPIRFLRVRDRFNRRYIGPFGFPQTREQRLRRYEAQKQPWSINDYTHIHYVRPDGTTHCQWYQREPDKQAGTTDS